MEGSLEIPSAEAPLVETLTRRLLPAERLQTKMSRSPFVSLGTRLSASLEKAINEPSALAEIARLPLGPAAVVEGKEGCRAVINSVALSARSRTNTS